MVPRKRFHASSAYAVSGLLLLGSYVGCFPDLNALSAGEDNADSGGSSGSGGSGATGGSSGSSGSGATGGSTGGTGNRPSGGTSGASGAGGAGEAGDAGSSGTGGEAGGSCSTDLDVGIPEGSTVTDCGACGVTCSVRNASSAICTTGACEPICLTGFDDCNEGAGGPNDGCETDITSTPTRCGSCDVACSLDNVGNAACDDGVCAPVCRTGFGDCNASAANDGCETSVTTITNCGACGFTCSLQHAIGASCANGRCSPNCAPGYGNCNSDATLTTDDGCEVYLDSLTQCATACGGTAVDCDATHVCNSGSCVLPQGVAVLTVPLTAASQDQRYADLFPTNPDLTNGTVTIRLYAPGATGGNFFIYFSDSTNSNAGGGRSMPLSELAAGWTDQTFSVGGLAGDYDPVSIKQITIEVTSGTTGPWTNPTVIYIDSFRSSNLVVNDPLNTSFAPMIISGTQVITGSTLTWLDSIP